METALLERIEIDPEVMLGKPVIRGTRITVEIVLEKLAADIPFAEILEDYPSLTRQDILAALAYARQAIVPLGDDALPGHPLGHLLEDVGNQDPGSTESGLAVADLLVGDDVVSHKPGSHDGLLRGILRGTL